MRALLRKAIKEQALKEVKTRLLSMVDDPTDILDDISENFINVFGSKETREYAYKAVYHALRRARKEINSTIKKLS